MSSERYRALLGDQLRYLQTSCDAYDAGNQREAMRIAVAARVVFHDTKLSVSLLQHLGAKDVPIISSVNLTPTWSDRTLAWDGLSAMGGAGIRPKTDVKWIRGTLPAAEWWVRVVYIFQRVIHVRRRDLVLWAANKDGGAHVDETLPENYTALSGLFVRMTTDDAGAVREEVMTDLPLAGLRTMGFELLNSPDLRRLAGV